MVEEIRNEDVKVEKAMSSEERNMAMLCHLSSFLGFIVPFGNILGPVLVWGLAREKYPLVDDQGKESMNFQISIAIYSLISGLLIFVLIGIFLLIVVVLFCLINVIRAAISANKGEKFRYPLCVRLIK